MALSTGYLAALSLREREVLVGGHPIAQLGGDRLEVARASKLLRAEAFGLGVRAALLRGQHGATPRLE